MFRLFVLNQSWFSQAYFASQVGQGNSSQKNNSTHHSFASNRRVHCFSFPVSSLVLQVVFSLLKSCDPLTPESFALQYF